MELLSPAGNLEKLKYAILYGADAVYAGSQDFSLRASADNFTDEDLINAVEFCHLNNKKIYIPLNIYAHNDHINKLKDYLIKLEKIGIDAVIVSDLGVLDMIKTYTPNIPVHISTQANVTSYQSVNAYKKLGAKRIILARELTFNEIKEIREKCNDIELEMFVHGAMCISYSGRCLISAFLNYRNANLGECTQPCRWKYSLIEESRPNERFDIEEDKNGFYFMNSRDLCLLTKLNEIYKIGIDSVKIEGRMKSLYYVATTTRAYSNSLKKVEENANFIYDDFLLSELDKISHRIYSTGFFEGFDISIKQSAELQNYETATYIRNYQFVGNIIDSDDVFILVKSYHKITNEDEIEVIFPDSSEDFFIKKPILLDENRQKINFTKPNSNFYIRIDKKVSDNGIIRIKMR